MRRIGYYNGVMGPVEKMNLPMQDRALFFGDGAYDFAFAYNRVIFRIEDHIDRFFNSLKIRVPLNSYGSHRHSMMSSLYSSKQDLYTALLYTGSSFKSNNFLTVFREIFSILAVSRLE